jgi:hypothetical protein
MEIKFVNHGNEIDNYFFDLLKIDMCNHAETETIDIPGTDETITICHNCGYEV